MSESAIGASLSEDERDYLGQLNVKARRREFLRSRWLMREALGTQEGWGRAKDGTISWPAPVVGSLTHKEGHVALTFGSRNIFWGIGLDVENPAKVTEGLEGRLCNEAESALLDQLCESSDWSRSWGLAAFFSCKESLFKCHYPLGKTMFYFLDAEIVSVDPVTGALSVKLLKTVSPLAKAGDLTDAIVIKQSVEESSYVMTACWLKK